MQFLGSITLSGAQCNLNIELEPAGSIELMRRGAWLFWGWWDASAIGNKNENAFKTFGDYSLHCAAFEKTISRVELV